MLRWTLVLALGLLVFTLLDRWLWDLLLIDADKSMERKDWWQVLRQFGSMLVWLIIGLCCILVDRSALVRRGQRFQVARGAWLHRGVMLILAPAIAGGAAELLKGLLGRARPLLTGEYRFTWLEPGADLPGGLASSHTAVAFAGALMLARFHPPLLLPLLLLASGTMMTRLAVGAHFVTDCYVAIVLAWASVWWLWRTFSTQPGGANDPLRTSAG